MSEGKKPTGAEAVAVGLSGCTFLGCATIIIGIGAIVVWAFW